MNKFVIFTRSLACIPRGCEIMWAESFEMRTFLTVWIGQFVSQTGTAMTRFALLIWVYDQTGSATAVALLGFFSYLPFILASPLAGVWVDRLDRRAIMLLADLGAAVMTAGILGLYTSGNLAIWHLYLVQALSGAFEAFQLPAYAATITQLLPKKHYARAAGLRSMADSGAQILAPVLGGLLIARAGLPAVLLVDLLTFAAALATLLVVRFPRIEPARTAEPATPGAFRRELSSGFRYIWERPGMLGLMWILTGINLIAALTWFAILSPMVLARTGGDELALAQVQSALGAASVIGGVAVSLWGGPRRKVHAILAGAALSFLSGDLLLGLGRTVSAWVAAAAMGSFFIPFITSNYQAILQAKVPPQLQGRVFSANSMVRIACMPLGFLLGGLLADRWLEPALRTQGPLANLFLPLVGAGPGAGMAVMFLATSILGTVMSLSGYLSPAVRQIETDLPDHDEIELAGSVPNAG
jgi:MFS family permease